MSLALIVFCPKIVWTVSVLKTVLPVKPSSIAVEHVRNKVSNTVEIIVLFSLQLLTVVSTEIIVLTHSIIVK